VQFRIKGSPSNTQVAHNALHEAPQHYAAMRSDHGQSYHDGRVSPHQQQPSQQLETTRISGDHEAQAAEVLGAQDCACFCWDPKILHHTQHYVMPAQPACTEARAVLHGILVL
jgi:hypothetical protein